MSTLKGIAIRKASHAWMEEKESIEILTESGLSGDFRGQPGKRQVTVLSENSWNNVCNIVKKQLHWTTRRANLLIDGVQFDNSSLNKIIKIGEVQLLITQETAPCHRMDEACTGLLEAMKAEYRGGVCCQVLHSGIVSIGDLITVVDNLEPIDEKNGAK